MCSVPGGRLRESSVSTPMQAKNNYEPHESWRGPDEELSPPADDHPLPPLRRQLLALTGPSSAPYLGDGDVGRPDVGR